MIRMCALGFGLRGNNRKYLSHLSAVNDSLLTTMRRIEEDPLMLCYVIYQFGVWDDDNDDLWHRIDKQSAENSANTVELTNGLFQKKLNRSVFIMSALRPTMQWQEAAQRKAAECKWNKLPVNGCEHKIIGWSLFWSKHGCWRWKLFLALLLVWWKVLRSWYQRWR